MKKVICDACGQELSYRTLGSRVHTFNPLIHIVEGEDGEMAGYSDFQMNAVSGREVQYDLCTPCYNNVYTAAYKAMKQIQETAKGG